MEVTDVFGKVNPRTIVGMATVRFYDNDPTKQFGFLGSDDGKEIFFHGTRAAQIGCIGDDKPGLIDPTLNPDKSMMFPPRRGEKVVYHAEEGPRGWRALRWARFDQIEYDSILKEIEDRLTFRLVERKGHRIQSKKFKSDSSGIKILWEGKNLSEVRKNFPLPRYRTFDTDNGAIYFEVLDIVTQEWSVADDPR